MATVTAHNNVFGQGGGVNTLLLGWWHISYPPEVRATLLNIKWDTRKGCADWISFPLHLGLLVYSNTLHLLPDGVWQWEQPASKNHKQALGFWRLGCKANWQVLQSKKIECQSYRCHGDVSRWTRNRPWKRSTSGWHAVPKTHPSCTSTFKLV